MEQNKLNTCAKCSQQKWDRGAAATAAAATAATAAAAAAAATAAQKQTPFPLCDPAEQRDGSATLNRNDTLWGKS